SQLNLDFLSDTKNGEEKRRNQTTSWNHSLANRQIQQQIPQVLSNAYPFYASSHFGCASTPSKADLSLLFKAFFGFDLHRDAENGAIPLSQITPDSQIIIHACPIAHGYSVALV
ncbi:MAG: hypothetical protein EZS28_042052, partial [Streblomastix strix]